MVIHRLHDEPVRSLPDAPTSWVGGSRRPRRSAADALTLRFPNLPGALAGRTFLHLTDFHIRRRRPWYRTLERRIDAIEADFVLLTGDYISLPGDEIAGLRILRDLIAVMHARVGIFGSFGNHDTEAFKRLAMNEIEGVTWLEHDATHLREFNLTLLGTSTPGDLLRAWQRVPELEARSRPHGRPAEASDAAAAPTRPFRILLGHEPQVILPAARFGVDWVPCGHTHGGQFRLGLRTALHNSTDFPGRLSSGLLRLENTLCTISRGLGESILEFRILCDRQMMLVTLDQGELPGAYCRRIERLKWW